MFSVETTLLGVALALDAAVMCFAVGLLNFQVTNKLKLSRGLIICTLFGFFQALMIWIGSRGGYFLSFSAYGHLYQLLAGLIFVVIGLRLFKESFKKEIRPVIWKLIPLLLLGLAMSLDALVSGISMGPLPEKYMSAIEIGLITFFICGSAFMASTIFKSFPSRWLLLLASGIFFSLGGRILIDIF